ncbi:MAG: hypothetical protein IJ747_08005 [Lachnospiraceae bacterium]|nr:hypothetical protein [Lachnospiraceae bacterium]
MLDRLHLAWQGLADWIDRGKLPALLLALLLYLVFGKKQRGPQGRLIWYGLVTVILCICPVTALLLMQYQTGFYDYIWIWSIVPVTALIAYGGVRFLADERKAGTGYPALLRNGFMLLLAVAVLVLSSGLGAGAWTERVSAGSGSAIGDVHTTDATALALQEALARDRAQEVLAAVKANASTNDQICLWAPAEILEYVRALDGSITLLYGRNMWDIALNAYRYEVYPAETQQLYQWMEGLADGTEQAVGEQLPEQLDAASRLGVNCVILPRETDVQEVLADGTWTASEVSTYIVLIKMTGASE